MALNSNSRTLFLIPLVIGLLAALVNFLAYLEPQADEPLLPGWVSADDGLYDLFLQLKPPVAQSPDLVLLNVDEEAIARSGTWPWPRGLMAQGLEVMAEFNARYAVFDIEYLDKSPQSVDTTYLEVDLRSRFDAEFRSLNSQVNELVSAVLKGSIALRDLPEYTEMLGYEINNVRDLLYGETRKTVVENDSYLSRAMGLYGKAFITLNMQSAMSPTNTDELRALAATRFAYPVTGEPGAIWSQNVDMLIPLPVISARAAGAGFTNVEPDKDGKLRRMRLLNKVGTNVYAQLAFRPLLDYLGNPEVEVFHGRVVLRNVELGGTARDLSIPLDPKGQMLINWPKVPFEDPGFFRKPSFYRLLEYKDDEANLLNLLRALAAKPVWDLVPGRNPIAQVVDLADEFDTLRLAALESATEADRTAWIQARADWYSILEDLRASSLAEDAAALVDEAMAGDPEQKSLYMTIKTEFQSLIQDCYTLIDRQLEHRKSLSDILEGSVCFIGWTATTTTDFGVTPFDEKFENVGTHISVFNTVISQSFLWSTPPWFSSLLALGLSLGLILFIQNMKTGTKIMVGVGSVAFLLVGSFLIFVLSGIYIQTLAPLVAVFLSFLIYTLAVFFMTEQEKSFLRKAFSTYMSDEVIKQIVKEPALLKLGGQKKWISAMFTDVRGFSTISEQLDPEDLVRLLNIYLSAMSDIILHNRGTIDKFEGDAIISFFGAPVDFADHAAKICSAAIEMKKVEKTLNERFASEGLSPAPLMTRIGINTGDMVVGNMGTEKKMDYTIMGNAVNLAARLEGVNKQYGSWILATETTKREAGDSFVWRRLDRVRVVGINEPLRLFELLDHRNAIDQDLLEFLARFDAALDVFESRDWPRAKGLFRELAALRPDDGPCQVYLKRSEEFEASPPPAEWQGVFSLTEK